MKTLLLFLSLPLLSAEYSTASNWLIDLNTTSVQMEAIQKQFRGFDTAMLEVGYRYEATKKAIRAENYPLASYHWDKIKTAMDNGIIRRPARKESTEAFFFQVIHPQLRDALLSRDSTKINRLFEQVSPSCNACHTDQKVGFIVVE